MSDINSSRVPLILILFPLVPYTGDDVNSTLSRGDK
jgi:amanitin/phalloidin family toxin